MSQRTQVTDPLSQLQRLSDVAEQENLQTDAELLELYVVGGKLSAMETLIRRYATLVASVCRVTASDPANAEDAFQATFLILLKSAKRIRRRASLAAWLHGVAYRTACRIRTNSRKQLSYQSDVNVNPTTELCNDPVAELARRMELEALDRELNKLPDRLREPLIEHYLLGYTAPQIAERMELSLSAVEGRLKRGRRTLRTLLARRGISLSVALAGASWFEQHLRAGEAAAWTSNLFELHWPNGECPNLVSSDPSVSSLVRGEMSMLSTESVKITCAAGTVFVAGALAILSIDAADKASGIASGKSNTAAVVVRAEPGDGWSPDVVAQFAGGSDLGGFATPAPEAKMMNPTPQPSEAKMMVPTPQQTTVRDVPVEWEQPTDQTEVPSWLAGGNASMQSLEKNRRVLANQVDVVFQQLPLHEVVKQLSDEVETQIVVNSGALELLGLDPDVAVTLEAAPTTLREVLRRICQPFELTYVVTESCIEITSQEDADARATMRFYDLAYVLPNSANCVQLLRAIQTQFHQTTGLTTEVPTQSPSWAP